jgi:hypothetical protein
MLREVSDYKSLPAWNHGMALAHAVYAAVEASGLRGTPTGIGLRKAAVSVPSLIADAVIDLTGRDRDEALVLASTKLSAMTHLLDDEAISSLGEGERASLLSDIGDLAEELEAMRGFALAGAPPS